MDCTSLEQAEEAERRDKVLEEAKKLTISEDKSLPASKSVCIRIVHKSTKIHIFAFIFFLSNFQLGGIYVSDFSLD